MGHNIFLNVLDESDFLLYEFELRPPTIKELYCDTKLQMSLGLLNTPIEKLQQQFPVVVNFDYYTLLITFRLLEHKSLTFKRYLDYMIHTFNIFGLNLEINEHIQINGQQIDHEVFEHIRGLFLFLAKIKEKNNNILEQDKHYRASQDMIARIKGQNKNNVDSDKNFAKNFIVLI